MEQQTRVKEGSLIKGLEKTSETLNKLVNYLADENKGKDDEINKILMINHPLIGEIRQHLNIKYNFYIEGLNDLTKLLSARRFVFEEENILEDRDYHLFVKELKRKYEYIKISKEIFESDDKLRFYRITDWDPDYVIFEEEEVTIDEDDLPF